MSTGNAAQAGQIAQFAPRPMRDRGQVPEPAIAPLRRNIPTRLLRQATVNASGATEHLQIGRASCRERVS